MSKPRVESWSYIRRSSAEKRVADMAERGYPCRIEYMMGRFWVCLTYKIVDGKTMIIRKEK